jgi:hypothetical protein
MSEYKLKHVKESVFGNETVAKIDSYLSTRIPKNTPILK